MIENPIFPENDIKREDAGDLLARLYREIGISAVAAALEAHHFEPATEQPVRELPAFLRDEDIAA